MPGHLEVGLAESVCCGASLTVVGTRLTSSLALVSRVLAFLFFGSSAKLSLLSRDWLLLLVTIALEARVSTILDVELCLAQDCKIANQTT